MADTEKKNCSPDEAKADAREAINAGATKVALARKEDGNWDLKITKP